MQWLVLIVLLSISYIHAQQTPLIGTSGYTEDRYVLNATEKQAVAEVIDFGVKYVAERAKLSAPTAVMSVSKQRLFYERWTNDTLKKRVADNRQSYEMPVLFAAVYHITVVEVLEDGKSERFYDVSVHRDRNKRLTVIAFTNMRLHASPPVRASTSRLSILSWNLWNYNRPWQHRLEILAKHIKKLKPDVIGFQEVRYDQSATPFRDRYFQVSHLAELLPEYQYVYQPAMVYLEHGDPPGHVDEGVAIFSTLPIVETSHLRLSRDRGDREDDHQRIVLRARIKTPKGDLNFYVTHLSLSLNARKRTAPELWQYVQDIGGAGVIVGDFNEEPDGPFVTYLVGNGGDFTDTWTSLHPDQPGWTFSYDRPRKRIDFVLARCPGSILEVIEADIIGNTSTLVNGEQLFGSDHFGVAVQLQCNAPVEAQSSNEDARYLLTFAVALVLAVLLSDFAHCWIAISS